MKPEIDERAWQVRRPGVAAMAPRPAGLAPESTGGTIGLYRVAKTDTLVAISERFYGTGRYAYRIADANKAAMSAAGGLKRGLVIAIPQPPKYAEEFPDLRP